MNASASSDRMSSGWVTFAAVLFTIAGLANLIWGLQAIDNAQGFPENGTIYTTLTTWGWIGIIWGAIVLITSFLLYAGKFSGAWIGIALAVISGVFWFFVLPVYPIFSLIAVTLNVLVIYGLVVHGLAPSD
jgi:hypothetical protein